MEREKTGKNSGAALVVAIVILMLVMTLSLALLLACFSLRQSAVKQRTVEQCKEIAQGLSKELEQEITVSFESPEKVKEALKGEEYPLWSYLRCNIWQSSWPYFNEDEGMHQEESAYKYFTLNDNTGAGEIPGLVTVAMYWESERGDNRETRVSWPFYIQITCQIGQQQSTIVSEYELYIEKKSEYASAGEEGFVPGNALCNPKGNMIYLNEAWEFHFVERE